jgi:hypothetical protein
VSSPPRGIRAAFLLLFACAISTSMVACTSLEKDPDIQKSGFLFDYSRLKPGKQDEAQLVYRARDADFTRYDAILLEPVAVWVRPDARESRDDKLQLQQLADMLHTAMAERLAQDYRMVTERGPRVMRLRVALTEAMQSSVGLDIASMIIPLGTWTSKMTSGTHNFVGRAGLEAEVSDSMDGRVLYAAVDRRVGGKSFEGSTDSWDDVHKAFTFWADRSIIRLRILRDESLLEKQ